MAEQLQHALSDAGVPAWLVVTILSALPISEVRGGIPAGYLALQLPLWRTLAFAIPSNVVSVVPVLLWFEPVSKYLGDKPIVGGFIRWLLRRARKREDLVRRYGVFAITLFVAIPLPVTGAWTGSIVASVFGLDFWRSLLCMLLGVCIASAIVSLVCLGVLGVGDLLRIEKPG
jgi:uncharacterized membrane protein